MNSAQLNQLLINRFPELKQRYYDEVIWQEGDETGSHVVFGDIFTPYIEENLVKNKVAALEKIFKFIEEVLLLHEEYSDEVILFSVLERLICNKEQFEKCKNYFGKCTYQIIKEMFEAVNFSVSMEEKSFR